MSFQAATIFPGDLFDAASRFAAESVAAGESALPEAWSQAVQMGWPAMLVGEDHGGPGGSLADLGAVIEGVARHALALPLARRCALVPALLMALGPAGAATLRGLSSGELDIDPVDGERLSVQPTPAGGVRLSGTLEGLDLGLPATHRLVIGGEHALLIADAALPAASARFVGIDGRRCADVLLDGFELPASAVIARGTAAVGAAQAAHDLAAFATAIEMAAMLGATIEHAIAYLLQRVQFGVALATFQVLRHQVVELYVDYECASALLARIVADSQSSGRVATRDALLAKHYLNALARRAAEASIQLHGGMGMTAELPATRLARRLIVAEFELGDRQQTLQRLDALDAAMLARTSSAAAPSAIERETV